MGAALAAVAVTANARDKDKKKKEDPPEFVAMIEAEGPYPSTYKPYPGVATALVGATVFDGAGNRIDNGTVLFKDAKVVAVGDASLSTEGYRVIDGAGKVRDAGHHRYSLAPWRLSEPLGRRACGWQRSDRADHAGRVG